MRRKVDDIITYALAAALTIMFGWTTAIYWPPWHRLHQFHMTFDDAVADFLKTLTPGHIRVAERR